MALRINKPEECETIEVKLSKELHPIAFEAKKRELLLQDNITEEQAEAMVTEMTFCMEVYYSEERGLFLIESEPLEYITPFDPYTGEEMIPYEEED